MQPFIVLWKHVSSLPPRQFSVFIWRQKRNKISIHRLKQTVVGIPVDIIRDPLQGSKIKRSVFHVLRNSSTRNHSSEF